jgi:hypothetical protein
MVGATATSGGPLVTEVETVSRNQTAPVSPGPGAAGTINDASNSINEFGLYDGKQVERSAAAATTGWLTWPDTLGGTHAVQVRRNQSAVDVTPFDISNRNSVQISINEYGLYDIVKHSSPAPEGGRGGFTSAEFSHSFRNTIAESITVYHKYTNDMTETEIATWLNTPEGGGIVLGEDSGRATDAHYLGSSRWHLVKVVRT